MRALCSASIAARPASAFWRSIGRLMPIIQPHERSRNPRSRICDAALVIASPMDVAKEVSDQRWVLSIQPLHPLSTVAIELFWHPTLLLGAKASKKFADHARKAVRESKNRGAEAAGVVRRRGLAGGSGQRLRPMGGRRKGRWYRSCKTQSTRACTFAGDVRLQWPVGLHHD
jgi:hypothetical protein